MDVHDAVWDTQMGAVTLSCNRWRRRRGLAEGTLQTRPCPPYQPPSPPVPACSGQVRSLCCIPVLPVTPAQRSSSGPWAESDTAVSNLLICAQDGLFWYQAKGPQACKTFCTPSYIGIQALTCGALHAGSFHGRHATTISTWTASQVMAWDLAWNLGPLVF